MKTIVLTVLSRYRSRPWVSGVIGLATALAFVASTRAVASPRPAALPPTSDGRLDTKLAQTFRIDIEDLQIDYDFWPQTARIDGHAVLRFRLRPGQSRALFHFNPLRAAPQEVERGLLHAVILDGEPLNPEDDADLQQILPAPTAEPAFEIQRDLAPDGEHTLETDWSMSNPQRPKYQGWFYANFDDTEGPRHENEALWPTISSPEEFARHRIQLRVHDAGRYTVIGSGVVQQIPVAGAVQSWKIDTGRPIASHTVFFAAVPLAQLSRVSFQVGDVPVTIVSDRPPQVVDRAEEIIQDTITQLVADFGPFPEPAMQVLLTGWTSGMEYYGATRTGIGSLEHELVHMYFGTATVNRTWRDTWFDEAAVQWWQGRNHLPPLPDGFMSDIANDRSVVAPGFNVAAYDAGARILGEVAQALGGNQAMIGFLRDLHQRRAFDPFTTRDLIGDIVAAQDVLDRAQLEQWLYSDE